MKISGAPLSTSPTSASTFPSALRRADCPQCFPGGSDITADLVLNPGKSYTLEAAFPNTKDYYYYVVQAGTVNVDFSFNWTEGALSNSTTISAKFVYR
jgi:hypothetical protein